MARYILIDNYSGYIWGDSADFEGRVFSSALEYAVALDESNGEFGRSYDEKSFRQNDGSGYLVYTAPDTFPLVHDGQSKATIEAVERDCDEESFIEYIIED